MVKKHEDEAEDKKLIKSMLKKEEKKFPALTNIWPPWNWWKMRCG